MYAVEVSQAFVDSNSGIYQFSFENYSDDMTFKLSLFEDGVTSGNVDIQGLSDTYKPKEVLVGTVQFLAAGTYYMSVESTNWSGTTGGIYEIKID